MKFELVPDPGADDPAGRAAVIALRREGLMPDERPASYDGAWRRAGLQENVERSPDAPPRFVDARNAASGSHGGP